MSALLHKSSTPQVALARKARIAVSQGWDEVLGWAVIVGSDVGGAEMLGSTDGTVLG